MATRVSTLGGGGKSNNIWSPSGGSRSPGWFIPMAPSTPAPTTPANVLAMAGLLDYLSPEDRRAAMDQLYRSDPAKYAQFANAQTAMEVPVTNVGTQNRMAFTSKARAEGVLAALNKLQAENNQTDATSDKGLLWLKNVARLAYDYGNLSGSVPTYVNSSLAGTTGALTGTPTLPQRLVTTQPVEQSGQTRAQYRAFVGNLDALMREAETDTSKAAYKNLATMITQPYFSAGSVMPKYQTSTGKWVFGEKNKSWV